VRISRVCIENFRNFKLLDVELGQNIVLVGENKSGKSNFIEALRLVLDPSLSDSDRQLTE
jgi:putative ATP-dependent endonuclease of OLD family